MNSILKFSFLVLLATNLFAQKTKVDSMFAQLQFAGQRFSSNVRFAGLACAGIAVPEDEQSITLNPTLMHAWHLKNKTRYSGSVSFCRPDSLFSKFVLSSGGSWFINDKTSLGLVYRNLRHADDNFQNDVIVSVAGRLFERSPDQGAVNMGMNIRYEDLSWSIGRLDSLPITKTIFKDSGTIDTVILIGKNKNYDDNGLWKERRVLFDLGFFQDDIVKGLDFGLVFYNIFGYVWRVDIPGINHNTRRIHDSLNTIFPDTLYDTAYYEIVKERQWEYKGLKRLSVGIAYHTNILQDKVMLLAPFDLEFLTLFDRKQDNIIAIHTGLEAWFVGKICVRFGYAYAPKDITGLQTDCKILRVHTFTGGISGRFNHVAFDLYVQQRGAWGISAGVAF